VLQLLDPVSFFYPLFYKRTLGELEWSDHFINTRAADSAFVAATYSLLVPEPNQPLYDLLNVTGFVSADLPKAYVLETQDFVSGAGQPDPSIWLTFSARLAGLKNGGYEYRVFNTSADHQGFLTDPVNSAKVLLKAVQYLGG
jgi:hypothetical protein